MITAGGSAVPRALIEAFETRVGVPLTQGWGMTETSPLAALAIPPAGCPPEEEIEYRVKAGRVVAGVEMRVVARTATILPNDGESVGEFEVRGPWVTASYYKEPDPTGSMTAGCAPATSAPSTPRATCRSPTAPRTSSSRAASGSPRLSWRTR